MPATPPALHPASLSLLHKARELVSACDALMFREPTDAEARALRAAGAARVIVLPLPRGCLPWDVPAARAVVRATRVIQPDIALFAATTTGRALAPYAAALLETGLTADCTALSLTREGLLLQTRPAFGGNVVAEIVCKTARPQMASVRPAIFGDAPAATLDTEPTAVLPLDALDAPLAPAKVPASPTSDAPPAPPARLLARTLAPNAVPLSRAEIILAGGMGLSREGFRLLRAVCEKTGARLGATRSAVDAGFAPYACQIGQTGTAVRPLLYVGFGVSGAAQHVAGMRASRVAAAVNTDPLAPIFGACDNAFLADAEETLRRLFLLVSTPEKSGIPHAKGD